MTGIRACLDSNVLVYAALEPDSKKGKRASEVLKLAAPRGIIATQALLEFVAVVRRHVPALTPQAIRQAEAWAGVFETPATTSAVARAAHLLVQTHGLQVWDAVIWSASRLAGASLFLTEDLQDGLVLEGMHVMSPFVHPLTEIRTLLG